jgi:hypothetical protein
MHGYARSGWRWHDEVRETGIMMWLGRMMVRQEIEAQTTAGKVEGGRVCDVNDSVARKDEFAQTTTRL